MGNKQLYKLGDKYQFFSQITTELITGKRTYYLCLVLKRIKTYNYPEYEMASLHTIVDLLNAQNNLIDNAWFKKRDIFNTEIQLENGTKT